MTTVPLNADFDRIRTHAILGAGTADGDLLSRFIDLGEEPAFEALVRRHGPMVLAVCRRILHNDADAEDAFQVTFLVLVRKARTIRRKEGLANWLYGVAHNTALKARAMRRTRHTKERLTGKSECPVASHEQETDQEQLLALLDAELRLLPAHYRTPIVLCDLEGLTIQEAAKASGCPWGTIASRLARGRSLLTRRLSRHGLTLSVGALAMGLAEAIAAAGLPSPLVSSVVRSGSALATGNGLVPGVIPDPVLALTQGVLKMMFLKTLMTTGLALVAVAISIAAVGAIAFTHPAAPAAAAPPITPDPRKSPQPVVEAFIDPLSAYALRNPLVAEELKLTDEQKKKIDEAFAPILKEQNEAFAPILKELTTQQKIGGPEGDKRRKELEKELLQLALKANEKMGKAYADISKTVLRPEQAKRVDQITLQMRFPVSYMIPRVITGLKLTEDQLKKMLAVITDYNSAMIEWAKDTTGVGTPEHAADQIRIIKTASGKFNDILTKDQQAAWKGMIGDELPLEKIRLETTALGGAATPKIAAPVVAPPPIVELPQPPPPPEEKQPQ